MSGKRIVVIGAGVVGRALTRALHARGDQVTVLSPKPVNLPALWRLTDAVSGEGLRRGVRGAQIVVFAASAQDPKGADEVLRLGAHHAAAPAANAATEWSGSSTMPPKTCSVSVGPAVPFPSRSTASTPGVSRPSPSRSKKR